MIKMDFIQINNYIDNVIRVPLNLRRHIGKFSTKRCHF